MTCTIYRAAIAAFDLRGGDLSDLVALHMDACDTCRAAFDRRFPPWRDVGDVGAAAAVGSRLGTARRPGRWWIPAGVVAAGVGVALAAGGLLLARVRSETEPLALTLVDAARPAGDLRGVPWLVGQGSDQFGALTVVVFWETWCPHCDEALLGVEALYDALAADGLDVVGVTTLSKGITEREALDYIDATGLSFPQAWDRDRILTERFDNTAWPRAYVVRDGLIVWEGHPQGLESLDLGGMFR